MFALSYNDYKGNIYYIADRFGRLFIYQTLEQAQHFSEVVKKELDAILATKKYITVAGFFRNKVVMNASWKPEYDNEHYMADIRYAYETLKASRMVGSTYTTVRTFDL